MSLYRVLIVGFLLALSACGGSGNSSSGGGANLDGTYKVFATSQTRVVASGYCGDGSGYIKVRGSTVSGNVTDTWGNAFKVRGSITNGSIFNATAESSYNLVTYSGKINKTKGSGSWKDKFACYGDWNAIRE